MLLPTTLVRAISLKRNNIANANPNRGFKVGEATGPISGQPPKVSESTKAALNSAAENDSTGSHVGGKDAGSKIDTPGAGGEKVKSEKECMIELRSLHDMEILNPRSHSGKRT